MNFMHQKWTLPKNIAWAFSGGFAVTLANSLILIIIAKTSSPAMMGQYALAQGIVIPVMTLFSCNMRVLIATDARSSTAFTDYFHLRLVMSALAFIAIGAGSTAVFGFQEITLAIVIFAVIKALDSISDLIHGSFQKRQRLQPIAIALGAKALLSAAFFCLTMIISSDLLWSLLALLGAQLIATALIDMRLYGRQNHTLPLSLFSGRWSLSYLRQIFRGPLLRLGVPIAVISTLASFAAYSPRYFLEFVIGNAAVGIFAAQMSLVGLVDLPVSAIGQAILPKLSAAFQEGNDTAFSRTLSRSLMLTLVFCSLVLGALALFSEPLMELLYAHEYSKEKRTLLMLVAAASLTNLGNILGCAIAARRNFRLPVFAQLANMACVILLCYPLISHFSLEGAALATMCGAFFPPLFYSVALFLGRRQQRPRSAV